MRQIVAVNGGVWNRFTRNNPLPNANAFLTGTRYGVLRTEYAVVARSGVRPHLQPLLQPQYVHRRARGMRAVAGWEAGQGVGSREPCQVR